MIKGIRKFESQRPYHAFEAYAICLQFATCPLFSLSRIPATLSSEDYGQALDDTAQGYIERINKGALRMEQLITLHEGRIWAESEVSKGARFYFALPV